jgi:hypothetical protein
VVSPQAEVLRQDRWKENASSTLSDVRRHPSTGVIYALGDYRNTIMSGTRNLQVVTLDPDFRRVDVVKVEDPGGWGGGFLDRNGKIVSHTWTSVSVREFE